MKFRLIKIIILGHLFFIQSISASESGQTEPTQGLQVEFLLKQLAANEQEDDCCCNVADCARVLLFWYEIRKFSTVPQAKEPRSKKMQ